MSPKSNELPETRNIACPYCNGSLTVSVNCVSIPCNHCNKHINAKEIIFPPEKKRISHIGKKKILCFKCNREIFTDEKAQATTCQHCYNSNDLSDHKVKTLLGVNLETYGTLHLKKRGIIEISSIHVGNAIVKGKINGDINAMGTVEIKKKGEVYGKITCRKLIVNKGGVFSGKVKMLNSETN
ncbi:integral membrane protein [Candidatus Scalindua japonica]|uniref:Integral membrane protein n=1 Tax=Candidatus Scalindua japonica TaxID=1284222 RepID=A0A286TVS2_9BACT|nr:polymer-forming cytoskeletal protein [Candidatus Scalindua japonica]GAX59955.1 integral membrane protein [Candidatus Scalindua japonica]